MTAPRIAARYAEAFFDVARECDAVERFRAELSEMARLAAASADLRNLLQRPDVPPDSKIAALDAALGGRFSRELLALLAAAIARGRGDAIEGIAKAFGELSDRSAGVVVAEAVTAVPLSTEQRGRLIGALERLTGQRVRLEERLDAGVLAGVRLRVGDRLIDGSASGRLARLREQLMDVRG